MATKRWSGLNTYTVHEAQNASLGQGGSALITGTAAAVAATGKAIIAITFLATASVNSISNGSGTDGEVFAAGVTIYGRWSQIQLASGKVMVYLG